MSAARVLILGGTAEAAALANALAGDPALEVTVSLAGRTAAPRALPVRTRVGGFGGVEGLAIHLAAARVARLVDATHPFAARISAHAAEAAARTGVPLLALRRPAWQPREGDAWEEAGSVAEAAARLAVRAPTQVFLTTGRLELAAFAAAPAHDYLVRTIEPVGDALPGVTFEAIEARGPFAEGDERALMRERGIELLVTKNAGGAATYPKVAAARALGLPVLMVARPRAPDGVRTVATVEAAAAWCLGAGEGPRR